MGKRTKWVIAVITVIALACTAVSSPADARRRCRRHPRRCRPRPVQPVPQPPVSGDRLVIDGGNIASLDNGSFTDAWDVALGGRRVVDVDVELRGLSNERMDDVDVALRGPGDITSLLITDAGEGSAARGLSLTLDDEATSSLPRTGSVSSGSYKPTSHGSFGPVASDAPARLSVFDGITEDGQWSLRFLDDTLGAPSTLRGWSLYISLADVTVAPVPPAPVPPGGGETLRLDSTDVPVTIGDSDVVATTVNVPDLGGRTVTDVNVVFYGLSHTAVDDLDIKLENGTQIREVVLMSDVGSGPVDDVTFRLDDESDVQLPDTGPLVNRTEYRPRNIGTSDSFGSPDVLSEFDGTDPAGQWVMTILDDASGDAGSLRGWTLELTLSS
jgi:hypothetical protein